MGQTITVTTIIDLVSKSPQLSGLSGETINRAGAAGVRLLGLSSSQLTVLVGIWNEATKRTMYLGVAFIAASVPFTLGMEWLNSRKVAAAKDAEQEEQLRAESDPEQEKCDTQERPNKVTEVAFVETPSTFR